ncbi:MAG: hypothetical protein FWE53_02245 [Firmicutes bacterium]|nr:hypothetical protein [Bacillota bacterium]
MLDKRTSLLLNAINKFCAEGSYKLIEWSALLSEMPAKYKIDKDNLAQMISYLTSREFIDVKYTDDNEIMVSPLPKGRLYNEKEQEVKSTKRQDLRGVLYTIIGAGIAAFAGAALAVFIFT